MQITVPADNIQSAPFTSTITLKYHVIFWIIYFTLNVLRWGSYYDDYSYSFYSNILGFPIHMTLVYWNLYFLMPKLVLKRKFVWYAIALITSIFCMVVIKFNLTFYILSTNVWPEGPVPTSSLAVDYVVDMMIGELYVITFVTAIITTMDWLREHKRLTNMEKLQLETELLFLRTQVSPHFFFNTLNNIYSLAMQRSDKTPKTILKLSELMRYLLYETNQPRQDLEKEIICLDTYLDLERMRYGEQLEINMDISGDITDKKIAPMLLLSFVENAFKHGANKNIGLVKIDIDFKIEGEYLYFSISNPMPTISEYKTDMESQEGIGLNNVKKRLSLGYPKDAYDLQITQTETLFTVNLKIKV